MSKTNSLIAVQMCLAVALTSSSYASASAGTIEFPGPDPGSATARLKEGRLELGNRAISAGWHVTADGVRPVRLVDHLSNRSVDLAGSELFVLRLSDGRTIKASQLKPTGPVWLETIDAHPKAARLEERSAGHRASIELASSDGSIGVLWTATMRDAANYITTETTLTAVGKDLPLAELVVLDLPADGAKVLGAVQGSPVVRDTWFFACEHPLANNRIEEDRIIGGRLRPTLKAGKSTALSAVVGVVPPGQLRRGFLYYLERRRAHPYRPFLHYNSWYHLNIGRPNVRMFEPECLETIEKIGQELIERRGVKLDAFVWDDGWDDFSSLWKFHDGFPHGFSKTQKAAEKFGVAQGVWMSPWGGYGKAKQQRIHFGRQQGFETNRNGFSMAGPKYFANYRDVCLDMMRRYGVSFFKFDGMGGGNIVAGAQAEQAADVDAVLRLTHILRAEDPNLFISATVGTWPSPFWTLYADSIWRQGGDTGFYGAGNRRQQWITYRDMYAHRRIVRRGPLYPLNSVMFHGLCIGERAKPRKMPRDEKSVVDEIWTMFGCGMGLQELYISPHLLTPKMWDELAIAAKWSRANADVLVDSHWVGGDPGKAEVYGYASWSPRGGILVLRNPSEGPQEISLDIGRVFELPRGAATSYRMTSPQTAPADEPAFTTTAGQEHTFELKPFEVRVFDALRADSR